jgi:hypothetical protein
VLAAIHGVTAYLFDSAALLSLSIAALASWLGIERNVDTFFTDKVDTAGRAFVCALIVSVWRFANRRAGFVRVFDHFILNLALWGGLILTFNDDTQHLGFLVTVALACVTIAYGFRQREESFVIYGYVYGVIAFEYELFQIVHDEVLRLLFLTVSMGVVVAGLYLLHDRLKRQTACRQPKSGGAPSSGGSGLRRGRA